MGGRGYIVGSLGFRGAPTAQIPPCERLGGSLWPSWASGCPRWGPCAVNHRLGMTSWSQG
eukprot:1975861-Pyramimonas_sp.AAC.1